MGDAALDRFGFSTVRPGVRVHLAFRRQSPQSQGTPLRDLNVTRRRLSFALSLVGCFMLAGAAKVLAIPSPMEIENPPVALAAISGATRLAQTQPAQPPAPAPAQTAAPSPTPPGAAASPAPAAADEPIGNVATL